MHRKIVHNITKSMIKKGNQGHSRENNSMQDRLHHTQKVVENKK